MDSFNSYSNEEMLLHNNSLQVIYIHSENTIYFNGHLSDSDEHILGNLFRKIKKIIFFEKKLKLNLKYLESFPHSSIALFYQLVKIKLGKSICFSFITSNKMKWQHKWLDNIKKLSINAGNQVFIIYQDN